jgi:probable addiction module antidote protein
MRLFLGGITGREALYKALRQDSAPCFDTINRVVNALGLKLWVVFQKVC